MPKGRPLLTLDKDPDRALLLEMEKAIRMGDYPPKGFAAAVAFAATPKEASLNAARDRLYKKYKKYRQELEQLAKAEESDEPTVSTEFERVFAHAMAGKTPQQKIEFLTRYLEITRDNSYVLEAVKTRFIGRSGFIAKDEYRLLVGAILRTTDLELRAAGITDKLLEAGLKMVESGQPDRDIPDDEDDTETT